MIRGEMTASLAELLSAGRITAFVFLSRIPGEDGRLRMRVFFMDSWDRSGWKGCCAREMKESGDVRRTQKPLAGRGGDE